MEKKEVHVKIGEVKVSNDGSILKATLGSCVGIAFLWPSKKIYGLAHCLLPSSTVDVNHIGAKYVNQAIQSLIILMKISPQDKDEIFAVIAGGGNMMAQLTRPNIQHVGLQNGEAAQRFLLNNGIKIKHADLGGNEGRQMYLDCSSGNVEIKTIPQSTIAEGNSYGKRTH